jgi:hypothetical protein
MRTLLESGVVVLVLCISCVSFAGNWNSTLAEYNCLEVEKIQVDRNDFSTKKLERAAAFPEEMRTSLQHKIVGEISRENIIPSVKKAGTTACTGKTLIYGGKLTEYKKGSRAARIMIGMGAGKQKIEVDSYIKDKSTGQVLATKTVVDRKFGGIAGGDEAKGERDFAEKVARFVKNGK